MEIDVIKGHGMVIANYLGVGEGKRVGWRCEKINMVEENLRMKERLKEAVERAIDKRILLAC